MLAQVNVDLLTITSVLIVLMVVGYLFTICRKGCGFKIDQ